MLASRLQSLSRQILLLRSRNFPPRTAVGKLHRLPTIYFEQKEQLRDDNISEACLVLGRVAMSMAGVERIPLYSPERRENNSEYSYMLALVAADVAETHYPCLDAGLVTRYAIVHDLVETITGDVPTFNIDNHELQNKETAEKLAIEHLCRSLPPTTSRLLKEYEEQTKPEARFVRLLDKLMPVVVDIHGPGAQVMHEDYQTFTTQQLNSVDKTLQQRYKNMFPEPELDPIHEARAELAAIFAEQFKNEIR